MGIKRSFVIGYAIFVLHAIIIFILIHLLSSQSNKKVGQANTETVQCKKKNTVVILLTGEIRPIARVIRVTNNGIIFHGWTDVNSAIAEMKEMKVRDHEHQYNTFIQYDKYPY